MYGLDNASGVNVMPKLAPVSSATPLWFTEGGAGLAASYPGQDWFNMVQAELLGLLSAGGIKPEKGKLTQLADAVKKIVNSADFQPSGSYATTTALSSGLALKFDKNSVVQSTGTSTTQVMSQDAATKAFLKQGDFGLGSGYGKPIPDNDYDNIQLSAFYGGTGANGVNTPPGQMRYGAVLAAFRYANEGFIITAHRDDVAVRVKTAETDWGDFFRLLTEKNTKLDRNGYLRSSSSAVEMEGVPIGGSIIWNAVAPIPENFWPNEGRSFSSSTYPELAKIFPSLKLPDDRGYAIRIADNGRGIDVGRTVGTYQEDAVASLSMSVKGVGSVTGGGEGFATSGTGSQVTWRAGYAKYDGANETRMKNVAKILITRMK